MSFIEAMKEAAIEVGASVLFLIALFVAIVMLYYIIVLIYRIITGKYANCNNTQRDNHKYADYQNTLTNFFINRIDEDIDKMPEIYTPASDKLIELYNYED